MASKKKGSIYKVGNSLTITKAPLSLSFLQKRNVIVEKANSKDVTLSGLGHLVVSRDEIKRKVFSFELAPELIITPIMESTSMRE